MFHSVLFHAAFELLQGVKIQPAAADNSAAAGVEGLQGL